MKTKVNADLCTGCGLCPDICPHVFELDGMVARAITETVPPDAEESCRDAAEACPVEAIDIED